MECVGFDFYVVIIVEMFKVVGVFYDWVMECCFWVWLSDYFDDVVGYLCFYFIIDVRCCVWWSWWVFDVVWVFGVGCWICWRGIGCFGLLVDFFVLWFVGCCVERVFDCFVLGVGGNVVSLFLLLVCVGRELDVVVVWGVDGDDYCDFVECDVVFSVFSDGMLFVYLVSDFEVFEWWFGVF